MPKHACAYFSFSFSLICFFAKKSATFAFAKDSHSVEKV